MYITITALVSGACIGWFATRTYFLKKLRKIREGQISSEKMIYDLILKNNELASELENNESQELVLQKLNSDNSQLDIEINENLVESLKNQADNEAMLLEKVTQITQEHIADDNFGVEQLSKEIGISRVHLNRKLKKILNLSPNQLILDIRMKYAARLLSESQMTVGEVAFQLGFSSHSYFSSKFKEYFGVTPSEWK